MKVNKNFCAYLKRKLLNIYLSKKYFEEKM